MRVHDLDTPALVLDLKVLENNIQGMATRCAELGIALRPHTKTHKIPEVAQMQIAAGARGINCQKLGEAEVMARAGLRDIMITYNIVGPTKVGRLVELARWTDVMVTVDSVTVAEGVSRGAAHAGCDIRVLVEMDTGGNRTGVQSPQDALTLGRRVMELPGLSLQGVMTYPSMMRAKPFFDETLALFRENGLPTEVISGGGTGHEAISKELGCTETRSGSYIYEGLSRIGGRENLDPARCPLSVLVTVVSVPTSDRIIIDGGQKTFRARPENPYGLVVEYPKARIYGMSVEHGHVDVSACSHRFQVGEKLSVIPQHAGMTSNLHDEVAGVRDGQVEMIWAIRGRGKVR